jgi:hypothetical protein
MKHDWNLSAHTAVAELMIDSNYRAEFTHKDDSACVAEHHWRNPAYCLRVLAVAAVWMIPGILVGLMAGLFLTWDPSVAGATGGFVGGAAGGWLEAA